MINITLKDGTKKQYEAGITILDIAKDLSEGLARAACAGKLNGEMVDLRTPITKDASRWSVSWRWVRSPIHW